MKKKIVRLLKEKYEVIVVYGQYVIVGDKSRSRSYIVGTPYWMVKSKDITLHKQTFYSELIGALRDLSERLFRDKFKEEDYKPTLESCLKVLKEQREFWENLAKKYKL